jgi:hypothetical protein
MYKVKYQLDEKYAWMRKGKKYKEKYLKSAGLLYGHKGEANEKDSQVKAYYPDRGTGPDKIGNVDEKRKY